jgi:hypothetical protein
MMKLTAVFHSFANMLIKVSGNWMPQILYKKVILENVIMSPFNRPAK